MRHGSLVKPAENGALGVESHVHTDNVYTERQVRSSVHLICRLLECSQVVVGINTFLSLATPRKLAIDHTAPSRCLHLPRSLYSTIHRQSQLCGILDLADLQLGGVLLQHGLVVVLGRRSRISEGIHSNKRSLFIHMSHEPRMDARLKVIPSKTAWMHPCQRHA